MTIYTIGHSTRSIDEFLAILGSFGIRTLADIRRFPGSRRHPQFGRDALRDTLTSHGLEYVHIPELGGRRSPLPESPNDAWKNASFRGYADHMASGEFAAGVDRLQSQTPPVAVMCAEAVPWRCHRNLLSDELTRRGMEVIHILTAGSVRTHAMHPDAVERNGRLIYPAAGQISLGLPS